MARASKSPWSTISLHPLVGGFDIRSRPADIAAGAFRWRLNWDQSDESKPCRSEGWERAFAPKVGNYDWHYRGQTRQPINLLFRSTDSSGVRRLFAGTENSLALLDDQITGLWTTVLPNPLFPSVGGITDQGEVSQFRAAELKDTVLFTNDVDPPALYEIVQFVNPYTSSNFGPVGEAFKIPDLTTLGLTHAKFVWSWGGFYFLANTFEQGNRCSTRIRWCDINNPATWVTPTVIPPGLPTPLCGVQDLPYGDEIMGGLAVGNGFLIFTRDSIYTMTVSTSASADFAFTRIYSEPEEQTGCLAYTNTLVSTGIDAWYMSRDGVYRFNSLIPEPIREDWFHKASGIIYKNVLYAFPGSPPNAPVAWYKPSSRSIFISWPGPGADQNNWTLSARVDLKTSTVIDHGFSAATSIRFNPATGQPDSELSDILVASTEDWCIKQIGGVFYREQVEVGEDASTDVPLVATYVHRGYISQLRGAFPLGVDEREKQIRLVWIEHDTSQEDHPKLIRLRVGNSHGNVDPNDTDDFCAPMWSPYMDQFLKCPEPMLISQMRAKGLRPSMPKTQWNFLYEGTWLYFELTVADPTSTATSNVPCIGADVCLQQITFEARVVGR